MVLVDVGFVVFVPGLLVPRGGRVERGWLDVPFGDATTDVAVADGVGAGGGIGCAMAVALADAAGIGSAEGTFADKLDAEGRVDANTIAPATIAKVNKPPAASRTRRPVRVEGSTASCARATLPVIGPGWLPIAVVRLIGKNGDVAGKD